MFKNNILKNLLIINLVFLGIILFGKMLFIHKLIKILSKSFLTPLIFSVFLFYIINPLNTIFVKNGLKPTYSALLTLTLGLSITIGVITFLSNYISIEFHGIIKELTAIVKNQDSMNKIMNKINNFIPTLGIYKTFTKMANTYMQNMVQNLLLAVNYTIYTFSTLFLVLVILFYLLKDGPKFKYKIICTVPKKYKEFVLKTLTDSDKLLDAYVTGQAKVALSLSIMIFVAYKIIGIPNALLFSSITFILAFIPFIGFFISMIIPTIIALSMGIFMFGKLVIVFIIIQTLKGRVVVPTIMSNAMNIHPLTDIFLVIGAVAVGGPLAAFTIVPTYAIIKTIISKLYERNLTKKYNK
ncbi:AI-2E family transporter [Clostridium estertheticum]|uniref:AI-2E family transporter n=1 Tax=Clostridium estertheticum TaxID=238834 RepID=UPI001C7D91D5|nr:AI-2E family transporter [Clostridium estertheticum]MBX4270731.1 AI-2E family transporter [Clostridium estertheticum]WLC78579.1 AI-2E family transporter [Clostridium estertheticum]